MKNILLLLLFLVPYNTLYANDDQNSSEQNNSEQKNADHAATADEPKTGEKAVDPVEAAASKASENAANHEQASAAVKRSNSACLTSEESLKDFQAKERSIQAQMTALKQKEEELKSLESSIEAQLAKLDKLQQALTGAAAKEKEEQESKVKRLVDTFETMSPKAAAKVIAELDDQLAAQTLSKLSTTKAGKVLANLNVEKASQLSQIIALGNRKEASQNESSNKSSRSPASQ